MIEQLQPQQVPRDQREQLRKALAEAITAAETALRALNEDEE